MTTFDEIIDDIDKMSFDSQEILVDLINKRFSEIKRNRFIKDTIESKNEFINLNFKVGNSKDLFKELNI
jgi:hypothetical protein